MLDAPDKVSRSREATKVIKSSKLAWAINVLARKPKKAESRVSISRHFFRIFRRLEVLDFSLAVAALGPKAEVSPGRATNSKEGCI